jgi:hypothetical protein
MTHKDTGAAPTAARGEWRYAKIALAWHGWGSPVGLGLFLVGLGLFLGLARRAFLGG